MSRILDHVQSGAGKLAGHGPLPLEVFPNEDGDGGFVSSGLFLIDLLLNIHFYLMIWGTLRKIANSSSHYLRYVRIGHHALQSFYLLYYPRVSTQADGYFIAQSGTPFCFVNSNQNTCVGLNVD